jgi:hypothetical protein
MNYLLNPFHFLIQYLITCIYKMSQRTDIYTLTGKKIGVITQGVAEPYTLTGKKIVKQPVSENVSKTDSKVEEKKELN